MKELSVTYTRSVRSGIMLNAVRRFKQFGNDDFLAER